jgi:hypothetical protein
MKVAKSVLLILCVGLSTLLVAGDANAKADVSCHNIRAKGVGQDQGGGVTTARIIGGGLLHGTTVGNFVVTGFSGTVATLGGTVVFTTNNATLTVTITGSFDVVSGEFSASGPVTGATGQLAGATGNHLFGGIEDLSDGTFVEDVTGQICVDLGP